MPLRMENWLGPTALLNDFGKRESAGEALLSDLIGFEAGDGLALKLTGAET